MHPFTSRILYRTTTIAWIICLLAACSPVPPPIDAPLTVPGEFSAGGSAELPQQWWRALDDAALDRLIEQALHDNFSLASVRERFRQARATARQADADLWPSLDLEANAARNRLDVKSGSPTTTDSYRLGVAAGYEIDLWGRLNAASDAATFEALASGADLQAAELSLAAQIATAWYQLVEQRGQRDLLTAQEQANRDILELVTLRFRSGQTGAADVLQQRQLIESLRGEQAQIAARVAVLEHLLAILVGQAPETIDLPPGDRLVMLPPLPQTGVPAELVQRRPDLIAARLRVAAADRDVAAAIAERFPRLSLSAGFATTADRAANLFQDWLTSLAGSLVMPLIDGGNRRAAVERNRAVAAQRLDAYGQAVLEAFAEVEDALSGEQRQREYLDSLDRQVTLAELALQRIRDRYTKGSEDYLRVLSSLLSRQNLQRQQLSARRQLIEQRLDLYRALAGSLPPQDEPTPNTPPGGKS